MYNVAARLQGPISVGNQPKFWSAMITQDEYYTGTAREYIYSDGRPELNIFTSHTHPWDAAPTYVLTEYVLGIQPSAPGFAE